jgi:hypothetical protein
MEKVWDFKILQVRGETRYMKIQKPGSAVGVWNTPLKVNVSENMRVATLPAVSASGRAAMSMWAKLDAKTKNCIRRRRMSPWRSEDGIPPEVKIG